MNPEITLRTAILPVLQKLQCAVGLYYNVLLVCLLAGSVTDEPHWMASLHHLTEDTANHRMPPPPASQSAWNPHSLSTLPPPGFHQSQIRPPTQIAAEVQKLAEG